MMKGKKLPEFLDPCQKPVWRLQVSIEPSRRAVSSKEAELHPGLLSSFLEVESSRWSACHHGRQRPCYVSLHLLHPLSRSATSLGVHHCPSSTCSIRNRIGPLQVMPIGHGGLQVRQQKGRLAPPPPPCHAVYSSSDDGKNGFFVTAQYSTVQ